MCYVIETKALIKIIKELAIGRSVNYWDGFIRTEDLINIANRISNNEIDKFGNETDEEDK